MKVHFDEIFSVRRNGIITPRVVVRINGQTMGPGVNFGKGISFGGVDLEEFIDSFLEVENQNGVRVIKGFYN
ncbi:MAG: hypothetical protein WDN75_13155 [Bacteroidota bacterium]